LWRTSISVIISSYPTFNRVFISASWRSIICCVAIQVSAAIPNSIGLSIQLHFCCQLSREWLQAGFGLVTGFIKLSQIPGYK
jgi:hypothetical protein